MKKRNLFIGIICLLMLFTLTGCGKKNVISTETFKSITESKGYTVNDVTNQYTSFEFVKEATIAVSKEGYQVEFYVLEDEANATKMFNTNKSMFESYKGSISTETSSSLNNYSTYTLKTSGKYMHICRVENTFLYLNVDDMYKDSVKSLIKELGY